MVNRTHNNPPAVILELDAEMAQLLLKDCDAACEQLITTLTRIQGLGFSVNTIKKLAALHDLKYHMKEQLRVQGVTDG